MELITQHFSKYSKSLNRAYERSISEQNYENHHHFTENIFLKGQNLNFIKEHSYRPGEESSYNEEAKDLTVNKTKNHNNNELQRPQETHSLRINEIYSKRIKQEEGREEQMASIRRYFCIFCKMDFSNADGFLDHLEMHPNGSFVLVKRDLISIPQQMSPKNNNNNNNIDNIDCNISDRSATVEFNKNINTRSHVTNVTNDRLEESATEEEASNLPIVPEILKNQIKIEPISDDEEENVQDNKSSSHINNNHHTSESNSQHYSNDFSEARNVHSSSPINENTAETGDPNQQLLVLSNPRIGDGPGEYLCNVCHAKFVYKNNLKSHLKRHLGIYPYVCFCGKRYQFKCKLNKHIEQAHAKIKNFKCPVPTCPKKYFTRNDLAFHISVTHQERQEIPCNICQKVFNSQKSLQIHCRKYHRNQET